MAKRAGNVNNDQKNILIEFIKKNPKLTEGKFTKDFTFKEGQKLWKSISNILNGVPNGGFKNWKQWRKVWQDMKTKTKNKKATIIRNRCQTGGSAPYEDKLDDVDSTILDVVSKTSIEGIQNIKNETVVTLYSDSMDVNDNNVPSTSFFFSDSELASTTEDPLEIKSHIQEYINLESEAVAEHNKFHTKTPIQQKVVSKRQRLEKSLNATETMTQLCQQKMTIKESYYKKKLELMEEDIRTKKEILQNLKILTDLLSKK